MHLDTLTHFIEQFTYFAIFFLVLFAGYFLPAPDEIILILAGYLAATGIIDIYITIFISLVSFLIGNNIIFYLSVKSGEYVSKLRGKIKENQIMKYEKHMKKHMGKTIFLSRFIIGLRVFGPFLAGITKVKWKKFFLFDSIASIIYVLILILLGYHFDHQIALLIGEVTAIRFALFFIALIVIGLLIGRYTRKKFWNEPNIKFINKKISNAFRKN